MNKQAANECFRFCRNQTASLCSLTFQLLFVSPFCFQRLWYATSKQLMQLPFRLFFSSPSLRVEIEDEPCRPCICEEKVIPLNTNWNKYFFFWSPIFPLCISIHLRHRNEIGSRLKLSLRALAKSPRIA